MFDGFPIKEFGNDKKQIPLFLVSDIAQHDFITLRGFDVYGPVPCLLETVPFSKGRGKKAKDEILR